MAASLLPDDWSEFLRQRGHQVRPAPRGAPVLLSEADNGSRYRWLLLESEQRTRRLTAVEHESIRRELRRGQRTGESVFVVVHFARPVGRMLVLPAERALRTARVRSDKGGIDWDR